MVFSVNQMAWEKAQKLIEKPEYYGVIVTKSNSGATIVDAGVKAKGGFQAGTKLTELCMGGAGKAKVGFKTYGDITFPSITISTDHPAIAALGSQFAGWRIKDGDNIAIGSGPARALALKPKDVFEVAMARTNDAILYGGTVYLTVDYDDEAALQKIVEQAPSMASKDYGKPFLQIFREADRDFYKIDHGLFAPALLMINNAKTGKTFKAGQVNPKVLAQALGF